MVTLADIQKNEDIKALISAGNRYLAAMGFTEHGPRHVSYVSRTAAGILAALNFSPREVELAASMVTLADIQKNEDIKALISAGNRYLAAMGFTEHGPRHVSYVSRTAAGILAALNFSPREVELAAIAGWVHDVGNSVNRHDHGPLGAVLLLPILRETGMAMDDVMEIITAVGNHEEQSGFISSAVSAALALGDKSDAHKTRVRGGKPDLNDIHDRVNFSIQENRVIVDPVKRIIRHELTMDESSSVMEYLQIYMSRIVMCEQAAAFLKCSFDLVINGQTINNRP